MRPLHLAASLMLPVAPAFAAEAPPDLTSSALQMFLGLGLVIGLLVVSLHVLKRLGAGKGGGAGLIKLRGAASVGPRERVVLVEVADKVLVLGVAPGRVTPLHTLDAIDLPTPSGNSAPPLPGGKDFQTWLKQTLERRPR
ncbi:flagellar biosynthetic protein FliO [Zoogloea sp.]|uniref:flagellar biosynthetic protein FliO n=1 Tax=Zoogloea sp. TaxID=49181 RepID=UPI0035B10591